MAPTFSSPLLSQNKCKSQVPTGKSQQILISCWRRNTDQASSDRPTVPQRSSTRDSVAICSQLKQAASISTNRFSLFLFFGIKNPNYFCYYKLFSFRFHLCGLLFSFYSIKQLIFYSKNNNIDFCCLGSILF